MRRDGALDPYTSNGTGTVFSITPERVEHVLLSFSGGSDGGIPEAGLINVDGTLYGTTSQGGASGNGVVFSITTAGGEHVLHSFAGGADGADPSAALLYVNGTLYGTTALGGTYNAGTIFAESASSGKESVPHSFGAGEDGTFPEAALIDFNGTLYGTTVLGCASNHGTVFALPL
jgi:uncharacterized repeat protein (TIGR03803 family)